MKSDCIASIKAWRVYVPLLEEWAASPEMGGHLNGGNRLIVRLQDGDGRCGWGEGATSLAPEAIEATLQRLVGTPLSALRMQMLDLHPTPSYFHKPVGISPYAPDHARLKHRLRHPMQAVIEMASLDLLAKRAEVPLNLLVGGPWRDRVAADYWMGRTTPEMAKRCVERGRALGFRGIKLKTTLEDPNIERMEAILEAGGPEWDVTVDPNGRFYRLDDALPTILAMDAIGNMSVLEDPFPRFYIEEFAAVRQRLKNARIVLHIDPPESLHQVLMANAVGGLNIDSHTQGLMAWRLQAGMADQFNLPIWHGSGLDLGIATAAQLHLASATPNCQLPGDQVGPWLREATLVTTEFQVEEGHVLVPSEGHGLGVLPDEGAIERYADKEWSV